MGFWTNSFISLLKIPYIRGTLVISFITLGVHYTYSLYNGFSINSCTDPHL